MRIIQYDTIVAAVRRLCVEASSRLPGDVVASLERAARDERSPGGKAILDACIENAKLAGSQDDPICQDTGVAVYFIEMGEDVHVSSGSLVDAVNEGTRQGYRDGYLRKSIVNDPLFERRNTGDNTPAVVHVDIAAGDALTIALLPKGGGSENMSALAMLKPSDGTAGVTAFVVDAVVRGGGNPCPPVIVGVGIGGGTSDTTMLLAKKALLRPLGTRHGDERYGRLEEEILQKINASGVGPQGCGGVVTALGVHIEKLPCHIASLPVAVSVNCHAARRATVRV